MKTLTDLRRFAINQSLQAPTTLRRAVHKAGFIQADPIRSPARAQDLMLRHRVRNYRVGDLERKYADLGIAEDVFINYGFLTQQLQALMHPRSESEVPAAGLQTWPAEKRDRARLLLDFVKSRGRVHPREVDAQFSHGTVKNYWGGSSHATTHLLEAMHYLGVLRVAGRERGVRLYEACEHKSISTDPGTVAQRMDALADIAAAIYAPLPAGSLSLVIRRLRYAAPQWRSEIGSTLQRAKTRFAHSKVDGVDWYWPNEGEAPRQEPPEMVRLLSPFDPVVWDRARFEQLWGWAYRFEAYTPAAKRQRGYYALPLLWRDRVIGWGNISVKDGGLQSEFGYAGSRPRDRSFNRELEAEMERMRAFLTPRRSGETKAKPGS